MLRYQRSHLSSILQEPASLKAVKERTGWQNDETPNKKELYEATELYRQSGESLLDDILEQFRWIFIRDPHGEGTPVHEWRHEATRTIANDFNGQYRERYLGINQSKLEYHLNQYLSEDFEYLQSEYFNRWLVDMIIYAECRLIALESEGRIDLSYPSIPFWRFKARKQFRDEMKALLPQAVSAYRGLDEITIDWSATLRSLNAAYSYGVRWRDPLPNFVHNLTEQGALETNTKQMKNLRKDV